MPKGVPRAGFRMTASRMMRDMSGPVTTIRYATQPVDPVVESRFSINERFGFIADMIGMLASGQQNSVIVTGPGGLGKSFSVMKALEDCGLNDATLTDSFDLGFVLRPGKTFRVFKGYMTAKSMYRTLYENREGVVVFDDLDKVLEDPQAVNILKGALDSYDRRVITWRTERVDEELPDRFEFKGRVIFISNKSSSQIDQAIITRSMTVDLSMTVAQKIERMRYLLEQEDFMPDYSEEVKTDAIDLIDSIQDRVKELSLRTLIQVTKIRANAGAKWADLAEYTIAG